MWDRPSVFVACHFACGEKTGDKKPSPVPQNPEATLSFRSMERFFS
jgi:hypothetical protein